MNAGLFVGVFLVVITFFLVRCAGVDIAPLVGVGGAAFAGWVGHFLG